uniref:Neurexin-4 n=2 Tax=Cacopsylla melanoneura TaxID=428564 RepID=A0A8D8V989_9HEMI
MKNLNSLASFCIYSLLQFVHVNSESDYYDCNEPLVDRAAIKATSQLPDREAHNARLNGVNAWSAQSSDFDQHLIFDLGTPMNITGIATQGRAHGTEYVLEYAISYGSNGLDYADYKDAGGNVKMFKGNVNGDTIRRNIFEVPVIAQWIRINPTRWRDRISMRVELYGCNYVSENLFFNGSSLVRWNLREWPIAAARESIRFRLKTNVDNGVLMYSRGTQGDFFALQLRDNRLLLNLDLGSGVMTSLSVGSLLDDNIWHDVVISRTKKDITLSVDRVLIHGLIKGEFSRLNLNREFYIGGVPNKQEGLIVSQNFTGCMENLYINATNLFQHIKYAYDSEDYWLMQKYFKVNTISNCPEPPIVPVTFTTTGSYARLKGYEGMKQMNVTFSFRTYENNGLLVFHKFLSDGHVKLYLEGGKIKVEIVTGGNPKALLNNFDDEFNDGKWHTVILTINTNQLVLNVDGRAMKTTRLLQMSTGAVYMIAGGVHGTIGFVGCMRMITVDGNYRLPTDWKEGEYCCQDQVVFDACQMIDRCNPNPCEHSGTCKQNSAEFTCDCSASGYSGAVCHTSLNPLSCEAFRNVNPVGTHSNIHIDVDGSGPLKPFPVTCEFYADGRSITVLHHSNEETTQVDGFQEAGHFSQDVVYEADLRQIEALVNRSTSCSQRLNYRCRQSRLFNSPSVENDFHPFAWWVSRNNHKMDYWGGSVFGTRKCECGILGTCTDPTKWCNCDAGLESWQEDGGELKEKAHLPVKQLRFGDTGTPLDEKEGFYTLGPLRCEGDDLFSNVVTFRISDASINLPPFDMGHSGDIYFEFKTTAENAVIVHAKGPSDFIKVSIINGHALHFLYQAGSGPLGVSVETSYKLNNNGWHSVSVERNRKEGRIVVDGALKSEVREPPGPVRALHLTSDLVIGSTVDNHDGYTGCIRALLLNGQPVDLKSYATRGLYGVSPGCVGKCESNPCLNNGTCHERYDGYTCDCRWTAFKGPICADEIGVNLRPSSMIKYDFMGSWRSTISENIRVGFTTTNPKGFLLGLFSNVSGEYMTIMISNSGHLRVVFDFGFERQELIFPNKHFGLGQYHDIRIRRKNSGATLLMQVDSYEPKEFHFNIKDSADAQFNNIQYMYIGRNESMTEGFIGCVSRVEFDDIYPLKLLFQEDGPANVRSIGTPLTEDFCGVEPVTHPPDKVETRPPFQLDKDKIDAAYNHTDSAILGGVLSILLIILVVLALIIGRLVARHKGEYLTQEDVGADTAFDPDSAVMQGSRGHQVQKKKEWFI